MRTKVTIIVGLTVVLVLAGSIVAWQRYGGGIWADLERAEARLGTPDGFEKLDSRREGTTYCVISCNEARIIIAFGTDLPTDEACLTMLDAAALLSADAAKEDVEGWDCFVTGRFDGEGDANITASIQPMEEIASIDEYQPDWVRVEARRAGTSRLVQVYLNSGID